VRTLRTAGFSLLELAVVLAILAAAVAVAAPGVARTADGVRARAEAGAVAGFLRSARELAVSRREPVEVRIDAAGHALVMARAGLEPGMYATRALSLLRVMGGPRVTFFSHGMSSGGRLVLSAPGSRAYVIAVDALTGRVALSRSGS
jgi:prepilin-type N-terminal cleavage/methylation domain-containing protein